MIPRITNALGGVLTSTFQEAVRSGLGWEGVGLNTVVHYLKAAYPANDAELNRFLRLYELAYDGINNKEIWGKVLFEIIHELLSPPGRLLSLLPKGFPINRATRAIWRLVERKITPTPGVIRPKDDFGQAALRLITDTFLDLGVSSSEHGWVSHMTQDLVVTEALRKGGESIRVLDFRKMMRTIGSQVKYPGNVPILLWNALYDSQGGCLTQPETVIMVLRRAIGPGVQ
jgi:hypothetical protein